ncbi:hypothetical protein [Micromonospora siamensis]|uniref:hypothetical protein n=1 Tax=Micromonospora siamensis TaxID=299152 RepID=UPI0012FD8609|nr:hypothetical protein [Micromonospora siamensis]
MEAALHDCGVELHLATVTGPFGKGASGYWSSSCRRSNPQVASKQACGGAGAGLGVGHVDQCLRPRPALHAAVLAFTGCVEQE